MFLDEDDKKSFAKVTGIDYDLISDDPDSIENCAILNQLINEYHLTHPDNLEINQLPLSLAKCGEGIEKIFHESLMELIVALGSTPTSAQKRALYKFINVCVNFIFNIIFFSKTIFFIYYIMKIYI